VSVRVDPTFLAELKRYGAFDASACFNCGNCTAVCPLSTPEEPFPRKMIRYAQVGMKDRLLSSPELWLCYYCGECSATCPRQAEPGEAMAAARRYAIASYDVTGLAARMYKSPALATSVMLFVAALAALFLLSFRQPVPAGQLALFEFIPELYIQILGFAASGIATGVAFLGVLRMLRSISRRGVSPTQAAGALPGNGSAARPSWWTALWETVLSEVLGQKRYRTDDCEQEKATPWYTRKWVVHAAILYGFLGLFAATALDFLFKPVGSWVPLWYPMRLLGNVAGLSLMYGTTVAMIKRFRHRDKYTSQSHPSDWSFLVLLWVVGLTGFLLELAVYLPAPTWGHPMLVVHVAAAATLAFTIPFSKFAHILYRTVALFWHCAATRRATD
jgi:ferredoxin/nitrate reductase gamma subunit